MFVYRSIDAPSRNHCWPWKNNMSHIYWSAHGRCLRHVILSLFCVAVPYISVLSHKRDNSYQLFTYWLTYLLTYVLTYLLTYLLTYWHISRSGTLLGKLNVSQPVKEFPAFMEPESSLPHSQVPATSSSPELDQPSPSPSSHFLKIDLNIKLPSTPGSSKWSVSLRFPHQNPVSTCPLPIHATFPAHLILDLVTRIIFGEDYRSLSSSLCSFLHSLVTPSLLGPIIFLSNLFSNTLRLRHPSV